MRAWDPAPAPQHAPLRAGVARCGGGGRAPPGGGAFHRCEERLRSGAPPLPTARPLGGLLGSATHVLWARVCGCGGPTLSSWPACPVGAVCRGDGAGPSPDGVVCQRGEGRLVSGAVPLPAARPLGRAARVPRPVCPGCGRCGRGDPARAPHCGPLRADVARSEGGGRASPGRVACRRCEGRLVSGAVPPPAACPLERAARVLRPVCLGCGRCGPGDPAPAPHRLPLRAGVARCGGGGRASPGGVPFAVVRGVWGQTLPLPRLPALRAGCQGPLPTCRGRGCAGVGALHRPRGPHALWGAARHGGGGGRLGSGAPSSLLSALRAGCRDPLAACRGCGCGCVWCVWCLCGVCRGAGCCPSPVPLVPPSVVLCCCVVPPVCLRCPLPCARPLLVCWLPHVFFRGFVVLYPFLCPPLARPPPWQARFTCLRPCVCLGLSPCLLPWPRFSGPLLSVLLGPVRQREDWGVWAY